jgi:predicted dehydrogenase
MAKVRVGMIGCGGFQRYRLGNLLQISDAEVVGLNDPSEDQIRLTKERHPALSDTPSFADYRDLLNTIKPDAVMIATPHTQHIDQILTSFDAGCHVLTEKPMVTTVADAQAVIAKRNATGKQGMVSYQRHFQAEFRAIRDRIQSGEAGKVTYVQALQAQEWKRGTKGTWRQQLSLSGGGQLNDSGSHLVDILLWSTGLSAESVSAVIDARGTEVDIDSSLSIRFKGGAIGSMAVIGDGHGWHEDVTIVCEKMTFFVRNGKLTILDEKQNRFVAEHLSGGGTPDKNFVDAILGRTTVESPFECGLEVIRLTEAAWKSAENGGQSIQVTE